MNPAIQKHETRLQRQISYALPIFLGALAVTFALSSCGPLPSVTTTSAAGAGHTAPRTIEEPIVAPHQSYLTAEAWFDITSSVYPSPYFTNAVRAVANAIDQRVQLNEDGATIYIGLINHNSFRSESTVLVITVPPLPADPPRPALHPMPHATGDPYQDAQNQQKVISENNAMLATWQQILLKDHAILGEVQAQVKRQTDQLRRLAPEVDNQATDIHGALARANLRFRDAPKGVKELILETDLQENTDEQVVDGVNLSGVHVKVFFHPCENASDCQANDRYWRKVLSLAGARDVSIIDPAQSQTIQNLFS